MHPFAVCVTVALAATVLHAADTPALLPIETRVSHSFATNNGVRILDQPQGNTKNAKNSRPFAGFVVSRCETSYFLAERTGRGWRRD
jgi:hypothetical protein